MYFIEKKIEDQINLEFMHKIIQNSRKARIVIIAKPWNKTNA